MQSCLAFELNFFSPLSIQLPEELFQKKLLCVHRIIIIIIINFIIIIIIIICRTYGE